MDRMSFPLNHLGKQRIVVSGRFRPNGANAVDSDYNKGRGFTAARTGTGAFTVTLDGYPFGQIDDVQWNLMLNAVDDKFLVGGAVDADAGTIKVVVWDVSGGAAADVASNANNWICFKATIRNSGTEL